MKSRMQKHKLHHAHRTTAKFNNRNKVSNVFITCQTAVPNCLSAHEF
jgi:hypothetical protein